MTEIWWKSSEARMGEVRFPAIQEDLYLAKVCYARELERIRAKCSLTDLPDCIYPVYDSLKGRGKLGEFPLMVVREHYRKQGYTVWISDSNTELEDRFILVSYPRLRKLKPLHPGYQRMVRVFGQGKIEELNRAVDEAKRGGKSNSNLGGGDPDLFVFKGPNAEVERFLVEVKHKDQPTRNQRICFPIIDKLLCDVKLVRIVAEETPGLHSR